jgi:hypothetical protein
MSIPNFEAGRRWVLLLIFSLDLDPVLSLFHESATRNPPDLCPAIRVINPSKGRSHPEVQSSQLYQAVYISVPVLN